MGPRPKQRACYLIEAVYQAKFALGEGILKVSQRGGKMLAELELGRSM